MFGLAIGTLWLIVAGTAFGTVSLFMIGTLFARAVLLFETTAGVALCILAIRAIIKVKRLPGDARLPVSERRVTGRRFGRIVALEFLAIFVVNGVVSFAQHFELIAPLDLIIVGIHFLPLAKLFNVPRYSALGVMFCATCVATLSIVPPRLRIGYASAWFVIPSLGCAASALVIGTASLIEVRNFLQRTRPI